MRMNELKHHVTTQINLTRVSEEKKQDAKEHILYDFIHVEIKNKANWTICFKDIKVSSEFYQTFKMYTNSPKENTDYVWIMFGSRFELTSCLKRKKT